MSQDLDMSRSRLTTPRAAAVAGIAFLWFIGVVRDRLGEREDRFFATVFFGSGLLFLAMLFASAAVAGGVLHVYGAAPSGDASSSSRHRSLP